jgi:hypothetical protein
LKKHTLFLLILILSTTAKAAEKNSLIGIGVQSGVGLANVIITPSTGNWGVKQAISCLDRKKTYKVKIVQGALQFAFSSLGIVTTIEHSPFLLNDVSLITNLEENK